MPSKGHDSSKGATGSTKKPLRDPRGVGRKPSKRELERNGDAQTLDISPSPGGWPEGQPMEQTY